MNEIYFKEEFKEKLYSAVNKFNQAVSSTMGPNGKTVIITDIYSNPQVTKDGVSVAKSIFFKDPIENAIATMFKQVAEKTAKEAGDGTTTATVLATAFINNLKNFDSKDIIKAFDEIIPKVLEQLKLNSKELKHEDIKHVASISANNDIQIGDIIQQAYNHTNIVVAEESNNSEDKLILIDGMKLDVSYFSRHFITDEKKGLCEMNEPLVLLLDGKLENLKNFEEPIMFASNEDKEILIITEHVSETALRLLENNAINKTIKLSVIKTPGFGQHRKDLIKDLSHFTGATIINDFSKQYTSSVLGVLKSAKIDKISSILIKSDKIDITTYIEELKELAADKEPLAVMRYNNLTGTAAIIKVGGGSELEMKERLDRYDDAVKAVACALEEGVVEGGGIALVRCWNKFTQSFGTDGVYGRILYSLLQPYKTIFPKDKLEDKIINNMFDKNIIDPLKVTRCALENAVSVAKTILSTETIVLNERQWN
jgi:chaperonin GroEL